MAQETPAQTAAGGRSGMLSLLKQPNFRKLWLAQTVSWSGDHFTFLALMIVINQITGSASAIALLMITMTVPRLLFGMLAGVFVDRWNRKQVMVVCDLLRGLLSLCLIWAATPEHVWFIYPLGFAISAVGVFFMPARGAVMKTILTTDELLPANILMQTTFTFTVVLGPALAGLTIGALGAAPAFAFDAATFFASSALVAAMAVPNLARSLHQATGQSNFWREFNEGLAFLRSSRAVGGLLLVLTVVSLATGAINALFVPFLMNILHVGAIELGLADSAQGLGMIVGGVLAAAIARRLRSNWLIAGGLILAGICVALIGLSPSYAIVLALLFVLGLIITPIEAAIPAMMQKIVPLDKMGRIGGVMNTSQSVATLVSMGAAGALADALGLRLIYVVAGMIAVIAGLSAIGAIRDEQPAPMQALTGVADAAVNAIEDPLTSRISPAD